MRFIAHGWDEEALLDRAEGMGLELVRLMSPDDNRRETADFFIATTVPPEDDEV